MQTLNIILLIASLVIMVIGIVLTWKPNPVYYFSEKTGKVEKYKYNHLFVLICVPGMVLFFLLLLDLSYSIGMIIYLSTLLLLILIGVTTYYIQNRKFKDANKNANSSKKKNSLASLKSYLFGFIVGAFIKNLLAVGIFTLLITIDFCYGIIIRYKKEKFSNFYIYMFFWHLYIITLVCLHVIFTKEFPEYIIYIILALVFLMQVMTFLNALDVKKHSPIYEKQYLEENAQQSNVSNTP